MKKMLKDPDLLEEYDLSNAVQGEICKTLCSRQ